MKIIDKMKQLFLNKEQKINEIETETIIDKKNMYAYYLKNSKKYVLVKESKFSDWLSKQGIEWIELNKEIFNYYREFQDFSDMFEAIQELNDLEKNTKKDLETERTYDEIKAQEDEGENEVRYVQADMLPEGWMWEIFDDASGGLISPTGKSYFSFDWNTYEYKLNENSGYDYFGNRDDMGNELTFKDFMKYAENYAKDNLVKLLENQINKVDDEYDEEI